MSFAASDLPLLLRAWAEWARDLPSVGYADSTTLYRAAHGVGGGSPGSREPAGLRLLEVHGPLRRLITAMDALTADEDTRPVIACVQALYLLGAEDAMTVCRVGRSALYERVKAGELLLLRELRR